MHLHSRFCWLLLWASPFFFQTLQAQDTVRVQTFDWNSTTRSGVFDFPDEPGAGYRKIWMRYNMRCHGGTTGGCREWDYSCNTFITDSSRVDSFRQTHPSHLISNFTGSAFWYTLQPTFHLVQYLQHETQLTLANTVQANIGAGTASLPLSGTAPAGKRQFLFTAAELQAAGLTAGPVEALELLPTQSGQIDFLRIRLKPTTKPEPDAGDPDLDGFTEVYFHNTAFLAGAPLRFDFYQPFVWDGTSNLLLEFSYTQSPQGQIPAVQASDATFNSTLVGAAADFALHFEGAGAVAVPASKFATVGAEITLSMWVKGMPEALPANTTLLEGHDAGNNRQINVHLPWSDGQVYWDCGATGGSYDRINKAANEADYEGRWNHWAFTKNAGTGVMNIYLNGQLWHSGAGKTRMIDVDVFKIGAAVSGTPAYFGSIDEFQIWNKALDESTIRAWMRKHITPDHPDYANLVAYFPMDEGVGNTLTDVTGVGGNATASLPDWRPIRGEDLFKNFEMASLRPNIALLQGDAARTDVPVPVIDQTPAAPHRVVFYGVTGSNLVTTDTQYLYRAGYTYIANEAGQVVDSVWIAPDDILNISQLVYFDKRPAKFEILSLVTPYGNGLNLGAAGKTFTFDVSDYAPILSGQKRMSIELGGEWQEELDIEFLFVKGTPPREVLNIQNVWPFQRGYYGDIQNDRLFEPRTLTLAPEGRHFKLRSAITGHGQNGEFVPRTHYLNVKGGNPEFLYDVWKVCSRNPIYPQGGTWIFDRAGWCPGAATDVHEFDISSLVLPGEQAELDYGVNGAFLSDANYLVSNQLVTYGAYNFQRDVSLERIARPNAGDVEFARINPACSSPTIWVRNTGALPVGSLRIEYRVQGSAQAESYDWTGSIAPDAMVEIVLPLDNPGFWSAGSGAKIFEAAIRQVNGQPDENPANDTAASAFELAAVYPDNLDYFLAVRTNNNGSEYAYQIKNAAGAVLLSRDSMQSNTTYEDALDLSPGCYTLSFFDAGNDGLSFWFFPEYGSGSLRLARKFNNILVPVKTFTSDFGAGVQYDFVIQGTVDAGETPDFRAVSTYPNPASDACRLELRGFAGTTVDLSLTDAQGRLMYRQAAVTVSSDNWSTALDLSGMPAGVYFLRIGSADRVWVRELVKG